jgi:tripartite ATP-independent transporter DctM subunit
MSQLAWPEMKRYGYSPKIGVCSIVAAAPLAFLIPPSTPMITYGMLTGVSIGALFMGGVLPGVLLVIFISLLTVIRCVIHPELAPRAEGTTWKEKWKSLGGAWPILLLVLVMMYCIWGGVTTVNESAGLAVVCILVICLLKHRLTGKDIPLCIKESAKNAAALFFLFVGIQIYNSFLSVTTLPTKLCNFILGLDTSPMMIVWAIIILYIILGCFIDTVVIVMLTVPLFAPIISGLGFSLVWFGCLQTMMVGLGGITPPLGMILFVTCAGIKDVPMSAVMKDIWPYVGITILVCVIIMYIPEIVTWLPSLM